MPRIRLKLRTLQMPRQSLMQIRASGINRKSRTRVLFNSSSIMKWALLEQKQIPKTGLRRAIKIRATRRLLNGPTLAQQSARAWQRFQKVLAITEAATAE